MQEFNKLQKNYKEYGKTDFLKLLSTLLDFQLPKSLESIEINFIEEKNTITIKDNKNIDYTLYLYEDYLVFSRNRKKYRIETIYSYKFKPYQNTIFFECQDNYTIALQETKQGNIKSRRLISYKKDQTLYPEYEKEIIKFNGQNVDCTYNYQDVNKQMQTYKVMRMENCIYYYHFQTYPQEQNQPYTSFLEVASTTNTPKLDIFNRLNEEESLRDVITNPIHNILILGTTINNNDGHNYTYRIKIEKNFSQIIIKYSQINIETFTETKSEQIIPIKNIGEITIPEINAIIQSLSNILPQVLLDKIIEELQNIQNNMNIRNSNIQIGNILDCNLRYYANFNTLALDILKNLSEYEKIIKIFTKMQKESHQLKLTKK